MNNYWISFTSLSFIILLVFYFSFYLKKMKENSQELYDNLPNWLLIVIFFDLLVNFFCTAIMAITICTIFGIVLIPLGVGMLALEFPKQAAIFSLFVAFYVWTLARTKTGTLRLKICEYVHKNNFFSMASELANWSKGAQ